MQISVVIPTCNRKVRLLALLQNLHGSVYPLREVIIVDSGEDRLEPADFAPFTGLPIHYLWSEKSVCIQRNKGIQMAGGEWIFLCDDDMEVPADYIQKIVDHIRQYPEAGAVSGMVLQKEGEVWQASYPLSANSRLIRAFIFQNSIWGEINGTGNTWLSRRIRNWYQDKGNHISKAGWPVLTNFTGDHIVTPVYGLGASVVRRDWLLQSPYDEVLDRYGIGDNYGVAVDFPVAAIHVLTQAQVYHHQEPVNRLQRSLQYYRRTLALHYFIKTKKRLHKVRKSWLLWSLTGNLLGFIYIRDGKMARAALKAMSLIISGKNPYYRAARSNKKVTEPVL